MLIALLGCGPAQPPSEPPQTCVAVDNGAWSSGAAFVEKTDEWGLGAVTGGTWAAGDLDGDDWPDLLATEQFSNARDDLSAGIRYHFVLMNREDGAGFRTLVDTTESSGFLTNREGTVGHSGNVHVLGDVDNDGDLDIYSGRNADAGKEDTTGDRSEIYLNTGDATFWLAPRSDVHTEDIYPTAAAAFTDYNADGTLDIYVTGWYKEYGQYDAAQAQLLRGNGDGTFTDVTDSAQLNMKGIVSAKQYLERGRRRPSFGATACDLDGDSFPELLSSNYGRSWNFQWQNNADGTFSEIGEETTFASDGNLSYADNMMYACWCVVNGPCDPAPTTSCPDIKYADSWTPGFDDQPARLNGNGFTTMCGDIDNDGDMDVMTAGIAHKWGGESSDATQLLLNDGTGVFARIANDDNGLARPRPTQPQFDWNEGDLYGAFFDFDNDGWLDILIAQSDYPDTQMWLFRQVFQGQFEDVSEETGMDQPWPYGVAIADFDHDGDLDVVTGSSTARTGTPWTAHTAHFYENQRYGNWVSFADMPVGTRLSVEAGGVTQTAEVSGGYGHAGIQNDVPVHFGLGDGCMVDHVTAVLPGGEVRAWSGIGGNRIVHLDAE